MIDVSIIIVNYNTKGMTTSCVQSIIDKTASLSYEIIVIDNASSDGSQKHIKQNFPDVILIESKENLGFGRANNLAANNAKGEYLFFLNSDTILIEDSIKLLHYFFVENEQRLKIGVLGCLLVDEEFKLNGFGSDFPNIKDAIKDVLNGVPLVNRIIRKPKKILYKVLKTYFEIDYVIGADMFLRRSIFKDLNGFDEDYFMYYEESDLQLRMYRIGFKHYILTDTKIIHLEDGSGKQIKKYSNKKRIIVHTSRLIFFKKNFTKDYPKLKVIDKLVLELHRFNKKYTNQENFDYINAIKKIY